MKQKIIVPEQVTSTFFALPCINSAHKGSNGTLAYLLSPHHTDNGDWCYANPGDILIEEDNGKWRVEKQ